MSMINRLVRDQFRNTVMPAQAGIQFVVTYLNNVGLGTGLRRYDGAFTNTTVIPAQAGIQSFVSLMKYDGLGIGLRRYDDLQNTSIGAPLRPFMAGTPRQCSIFTLDG